MAIQSIGEAIQKFYQNRYRERGATELTIESVEKEFGYIAISEKERALGLLKGYEIAVQRLEDEEKKRKKGEEYAEAKRMWSYEEMRQAALERAEISGRQQGFEFEFDEDNLFAFHLLCLYFTNDPAFEEQEFGGRKYNLNKGIWLQSPGRGTGKTCLLRLFQDNKRSCFYYGHIDAIRMLYQKSGIHELELRSKPTPCEALKSNFFQDNKGWMYDEFFSDERVMHMGSPLVCSEYIINSIYDFQKGNDFSKFHITSNLDGEAIEKRSGNSYRSRMMEMFNLIKLEGKDRRKK